jgi:hypothetical protein
VRLWSAYSLYKGSCDKFNRLSNTHTENAHPNTYPTKYVRPVYTVGYYMGHPMGYLSHGTQEVPRKVRYLHGKSRVVSVGQTEYHGISHRISHRMSHKIFHRVNGLLRKIYILCGVWMCVFDDRFNLSGRTKELKTTPESCFWRFLCIRYLLRPKVTIINKSFFLPF